MVDPGIMRNLILPAKALIASKPVVFCFSGQAGCHLVALTDLAVPKQQERQTEAVHHSLG